MASTDDTGGGNYALTPHPADPLVERQSAADYRAQYAAQHPQPGSIWSPQRPSPMAPPAPTAPPTPGTVTGSLSDEYAPQQAEAQRQQQLAAWQAQSMGQPMTADDAMAYMRRKTTLVQHATFMPHGGPDQGPAFAFGMKTPDGKSGGVNIVPLSQMVADGAGPAVAAHNTSITLSRSDPRNSRTLTHRQINPSSRPQVTDSTGSIPPAPPAPTASVPSGTGLAHKGHQDRQHHRLLAL
jgi:hypothetical protein